MTLFDHLNNIYYNKGDWDKISEADRKTWNTFMVHKYISMLGKRECVLVNEIQRYGKLDPKVVYQFYKSSFPTAKRYGKYIKGTKEPKVNIELVKILANLYEISYREATEYVDLYTTEQLTTLLEKMGYNTKEIKLLIK